jgi:uncharacterized membrane protein YhfC
MSSQFLQKFAFILLAVAVFTALGCAGEPQPVDLKAVWQAGEVSRYDIVIDDGSVVGAAAWEMKREDEHWVMSRLDEHGKTSGEMVLDDNLRPIRGWREQGGLRAEAVYKPEEVLITKVGADGKKKNETLARPEGAMDNEQGLQTFRSLPFAAGFKASYTNISAAGGSIPFSVVVVGEESVSVPAGSFETWHANLEFGAVRHQVWYGKQAPHLLVKYKNPTAGKTFVLRSWREKKDGPDHGTVEVSPIPAPGSQPISWTFAAIMGLVQLPLMSLFPIVLGFFLVRKLKVSWKLWVAGAVAFIASQVVHLPLNWAIGLMGAPRGAGLLPLPYMAVVAGLSAGVCEEVARYVALSVVLRKIRHSWNEAVQFGAGHGGIEAMILGALVGINLVVMIVLKSYPNSLGLEGEALNQTLAASDAFWRGAWHAPLAGGVERVVAIGAHIGMSVLVMRAIACRKLAYLFAAILAHTVLDAVAVLSAARLGIWPTELLVAVCAAVLLAIAFGLRKASWPENGLDEALEQAKAINR